MEMSLKDLRETVFERAEWSPTATGEAVDRVNGFINSAVLDLARDCPYAMHMKEQMYFTQPVVEPLDATDTISLVDGANGVTSQEIWAGGQTPVNPWVFKTDLSVGSGTAWQADRTWDGRLVEIINAAGDVIYRNRIRAVWREGGDEDEAVGSTVDEYRFSVVSPFPHIEFGTGPFSWRVLSGQQYFPNNLIRPSAVRIQQPNYSRTIEFYPKEQAERMLMQNRFSDGSPVAATRLSPMTMKAPTVAPTVEEGVGAWVGPEPLGTFQYRVTYTWGKQDAETHGPGMGLFEGEVGTYRQSTRSHNSDVRFSENRFKLPKWESGPSLPSAEVSATLNGETFVGTSIKITVPNIEYVLGYLMDGTQRSVASGDEDFFRANSFRSGWHVAIYRKRVSTDLTSYSAAPGGGSGATKNVVVGLNLNEQSDEYYLLTEMRIDATNGGEFTDDGQILPDYSRPLRSTGTHIGFELFPAPDERYPFVLEYVAAPRLLADDTDTAPVLWNAREALLERTMVYVYRMMGDPRSNECDARYRSETDKIAQEMGTVVPESQVIRKRPARAGRNRHRYLARWGRGEA